jgi:DNA sulfur modification protein DndE
MKPPVETVRISSQSKEVLVRIKRRLGIERWNEICRVALCRSLANSSKPSKPKSGWDTAIEIEWKTFSGEQSDTFSALTLMRAHRDNVDTDKKDNLADYFRAHLERGILSLQNITRFEDYLSVDRAS